jgi:hypothetical protein
MIEDRTMSTQKDFDRGQLDIAKRMIEFWENEYEYIERALENGRCNECNSPLMFDENETCEDCLCPE